MNARLFDRLAAAASIMILVGLGMLSYFLAQQAERLARPSTPRPATHEPDYFVEQLRLLKANAAGDPAVRVEASYMRHYPDDRTIEFDEPHVVTLTDDRPAIRVTARSGRSPDTGEKTDLIGNVRIIRDETPDAPKLVVLTSTATVVFDEKVVWSDAPVRVELGGDLLTGIGMRLDSQTRQLQVDSRVRGLIAPRERTEGSGQPPASGR